MKPSNTVLKLCSINLPEDAVDRIVKVLRTSGVPAQAQEHSPNDSLADKLHSYNPDLIMVGANGAIDIAQVSAICRKKNTLVPRLLVDKVNTENRSVALQFQYDELIDISDESWLIHVISREWRRYQQTCEIESLQLEFDNISSSHDQMVAASDKGIAYVSDGFHVTCTKRYASMFEYASESDVTITPLIDIIAPTYHTQFKRFLKSFEKSDETSSVIETTAISSMGKPMPVQFEFTKSTYDNEDALQIAATPVSAVAAGTGNGDQGSAFIKQLDYFLSLAKKNNQKGCVICIQPWNFWKTRHKVGILASTEVLTKLFNFISKSLGKKITVARIGNDFFAMAIQDINGTKAQQLCEQLINAVEQHIFEVDGVSVNCYCRAGIVEYDKRTKWLPSDIINYGFETIGTFTSGETKEKARVYEPVVEKKTGFDPSKTLSQLTQSGAIKLSYQPIVSLRDDPHELYEVLPYIVGGDGDALNINDIAAQKIGDNNESKLDRWLISLVTARLINHIKKAPQTRIILQLSNQAFGDKTLLPWLLEQCVKHKISRSHFIFQWKEAEVTEKLKQSSTFFALMKKAKMVYCFSDYKHDLDAAKTLATLQPRLLKVHEDIALNASGSKKSSLQLQDIMTASSEKETAVVIPCVDSAATLAWLWQSGASFVQGDYIQAPSANMEFDFSEMAV